MFVIFSHVVLPTTHTFEALLEQEIALGFAYRLIYFLSNKTISINFKSECTSMTLGQFLPVILSLAEFEAKLGA